MWCKTRKKKKEILEPPFEERESVCDDFSKRRKVSTVIGSLYPVLRQHVHETKHEQKKTE